MVRKKDMVKKDLETKNDLGKGYYDWISELIQPYCHSQIKAIVKLNREMLRFYWSVGKVIEERKLENKYGSHFYEKLSRDQSLSLNKRKGFAPTSLLYTEFW